MLSKNKSHAAGWETSTRPLTKASENLTGLVENRPGQVEFCIGYIRDYPVRASAKNFSFPACAVIFGDFNIDLLKVDERVHPWVISENNIAITFC